LRGTPKRIDGFCGRWFCQGWTLKYAKFDFTGVARVPEMQSSRAHYA